VSDRRIPQPYRIESEHNAEYGAEQAYVKCVPTYGRERGKTPGEIKLECFSLIVPSQTELFHKEISLNKNGERNH
jgi:hypothetical protein